MCLQRIQNMHTGTLSLLLQSQRCAMHYAEYQSKYNLQLPCNFHGRTDYWKCVYLTFDRIIIGNYMIPGLDFLIENSPKRVICHSINPSFGNFRAVCTCWWDCEITNHPSIIFMSAGICVPSYMLTLIDG